MIVFFLIIKQSSKKLTAAGRPRSLDWNGNEAEWSSSSSSSASSSLVASIKVSPLSKTAVDMGNAPWRRTRPPNILQLDGAADSSETDTDQPGAHNDNIKLASSIKVEKNADEEPVKCRRCRRSYRTWQSFNKHTEICVELLSSGSSSGNEDETDDDDNKNNNNNNNNNKKRPRDRR